MRIDTVHYCDREADFATQRKRRSFIGRKGALKDPPQERLHLFSSTVWENSILASQVQYLKIPYMTRETCKADLARTVSVLPNLRYVDLPDSFYNDDPLSNTLRQELQARCRDIRQMKYAGGAEGSFQRLAQARQWPNLEALELFHLAADPATIANVAASLKSLRQIKFTSLPLLDDRMFSSLHMSRFPPMAALEFHVRNILDFPSLIGIEYGLQNTFREQGGLRPPETCLITNADFEICVECSQHLSQRTVSLPFLP